MEFGETRLGVLAYWIGVTLTIFMPTAFLIGTLFKPHLAEIIYDFIMVVGYAVSSISSGLLDMIVSIAGLFVVI